MILSERKQSGKVRFIETLGELTTQCGGSFKNYSLRNGGCGDVFFMEV
jgi:hypothetical protein